MRKKFTFTRTVFTHTVNWGFVTVENGTPMISPNVSEIVNFTKIFDEEGFLRKKRKEFPKEVVVLVNVSTTSELRGMDLQTFLHNSEVIQNNEKGEKQ